MKDVLTTMETMRIACDNMYTRVEVSAMNDNALQSAMTQLSHRVATIDQQSQQSVPALRLMQTNVENLNSANSAMATDITVLKTNLKMVIHVLKLCNSL